MKKRIRLLFSMVLSCATLFGISLPAYAAHIYIEDTAPGQEYYYERGTNYYLTAESHSDDVTGYAYANYETGEIYIMKERIGEQGFDYSHNRYISYPITRATNSAILPAISEFNSDYDWFAGKLFKIVTNELYGAKANPASPSEESEQFNAILNTIAKEEALTVTAFTSAEAMQNIPDKAKAAGASYNLSALKTTEGFLSSVNKVSASVKASNASAGAAQKIDSVTVYSDRPMGFTAEILNAVCASDLTYSFVFMHNEKLYKVTIPKGASIDFSGHFYEGPLFIGKLLGTTQEIQ